MTYNTEDQLIEVLSENHYKKVSELLNTTNENLFIGPNNLLDNDKIESAKIFTKLITNKIQLDTVYPVEDGNINLWAQSSNIKILLDSRNINETPISNHLVGVFKIGRNLTSHMHIVHGGATASLIDEYFVKAALPLTPDNFAVTANLNIKYLRPIKFEEDERTVIVVLDCFIADSVPGKKFTVKGALMDLEGKKYCIADVLVVVPKGPL